MANSDITVGIVGLGIMGSAYASHLLKAGYNVVGFDVESSRKDALEKEGGFVAASPADLAERSSIVLIALASVAALDSCTETSDGLVNAMSSGQIVCEMGTFSLEDKKRFAAALEAVGGRVLDCPVSGTGAQAAKGDISIYVSGDETAAKEIRPVFEAFARDIRYVGAYGTGTKLKFVANLLVTVHNLAAAEALLLAKRSGLDLDMVIEAISQGAGTSRMFEVRGPMMAKEEYLPATMKMDVYMKDLKLITDYARETNTPAPLMSASLPFYFAGIGQGRGDEDTAALYSILKDMAE